jgi:hypothetical protein
MRGRGCLEVNPSPNPFFQTTASDIGIRPHDNINWKISGKPPPFSAKQHEVDGNFAFLYSRESDVIGSKIHKPVSDMPKLLTKTEFLKKKREEFFAATGDLALEEAKGMAETVPYNKADEVLSHYEHKSKFEDPRYTTSNTDYGRKAPSIATIVVDRAAIPQGFSKAFNGIKPQNSSMTTSLSRSNVHSSLDPQF